MSRDKLFEKQSVQNDSVKSRVQRHDIPQLYCLSGPPILAEVPRVANGHGSIDERSIDGVDEAIDSKANITAVLAGGG